MHMTEAQKYVERSMRHGVAFDTIEDEINEMALSEEQKSALWLLAWSYVNWRYQRRFARAAVAGLGSMVAELATNTRSARMPSRPIRLAPYTPS